MDNEEKVVVLNMRVPRSVKEQFTEIVNRKGQKQNFVLQQLVKRYIREEQQKLANSTDELYWRIKNIPACVRLGCFC